MDINTANKYFEFNKRTFTGVSAGDYIDKEDFLNFINSIASITWFKCEVRLPPQTKDNIQKSSDKVLAWGQGGWPQVTFYCHGANEWFAANDLPFKITHWSYINEPMEEQEDDREDHNDAVIVEIT